MAQEVLAVPRERAGIERLIVHLFGGRPVRREESAPVDPRHRYTRSPEDSLLRCRLLPPVIECSRCRLRPWAAFDKAALVPYANNRNVSRNLRDAFPFPYTEADADDWLARVAGSAAPPGVYAIEVGGEAAGAIAVERGTDVERLSAEIGYWLGEPFWGRGIVTEAVGRLTELALAEDDIVRTFAPVFAWNAPSMRVLAKK